MDRNAHVQVFHKPIQVNEEKIDVDVINLFYFTLLRCHIQVGRKLMWDHQVCKFEEVEVAFANVTKKYKRTS
jgi:hypothetical protein